MNKYKNVGLVLMAILALTALVFVANSGTVSADDHPDTLEQVGSATSSDGHLSVAFGSDDWGQFLVLSVDLSGYTGATVTVRVDSQSPATMTIPPSGSFQVDISTPLSAGSHTVVIAGAGVDNAYTLNLAASYWISFDIEGAVTGAYVRSGNMPSPPSNPQKTSTVGEQYSFSAWDSAVSAATGQKTYTAQFTSSPRMYAVTINTGGGTITDSTWTSAGANTYTKLFGYNSPVVLPAINRTGFDLAPASWPTGDIVTGSVTYTATWTPVAGPVTYTIRLLNAPNGTVSGWTWSGSAYVKTFSPGDALTLPSPSRSGYTFNNWSPTPSATVTGNADYSANWTSISGPTVPTTPTVKYSVTIDTDGGALASGPWALSGALYTQVFTEGDILNLPTPSRSGYAFGGWSPTPSANVTGNVKYTALWTALAVDEVTVHVTTGPNGSTASEYVVVSIGNDVEILINPESGYVIDKVTTGLEYVIDGNKITLKNVSADSDVEITFEEEPSSSSFPWWIIAVIVIVLILLVLFVWRYKAKDKNVA